ncbi:MAG: response regulator, partial [Deltaproteobacteria bacterium]|nr:response regulator [Deltaproteobacteria bacterium]
VIDDNDTNRLILRKQLDAWGARVSEADDGWHGIAELQRAKAVGEPYDLVLLDCRMPVMGGFEVAEQLKQNPDLIRVTIMMLTSDHRPGDPARARELGIAGYLVKPVKRSELRQAIVEATGHGADRPPKPSHETQSVVAEDRRPLRILLVEDHENNRMVIQAYLKDTSYHLETAENGEIACRKFSSDPFDLVLMDMQMPVMDGYSATRWIRDWEKGEGKEPVPIIALTAHALREDAQKCLDAGCSAYVSKPVRKTKLLETIIEYTAPAPPSHSSDPEGDEGTGVDRPKGIPAEKEKIVVEVDGAFKDFLPRFLEVTSEDIATMWKAIDEGDYATIERLGHSMKGSGTSFGFHAMTDIGKSIEQAAKSRDGKEVRKNLAGLTEYMERVEVVFSE